MYINMLHMQCNESDKYSINTVGWMHESIIVNNLCMQLSSNHCMSLTNGLVSSLLLLQLVPQIKLYRSRTVAVHRNTYYVVHASGMALQSHKPIGWNGRMISTSYQYRNNISILTFEELRRLQQCINTFYFKRGWQGWDSTW